VYFVKLLTFFHWKEILFATDKVWPGEGGFIIVAWIDFSNVLGSVSHKAICARLDRAVQAEVKSVNFIKEVFRDNTTRISTITQSTTTNTQSGIKQGCPIRKGKRIFSNHFNNSSYRNITVTKLTVIK
jgi:hypothetical protein